MSAVRVWVGLVAAALFLAVFGPARRIAQRLGSAAGADDSRSPFIACLCFILARARSPAWGEPSLAAQAPDRRQPCLLAGHTPARRDRADDFPGEKGSRRAVPGPPGRGAAGRRLCRPAAQAAHSRGQRRHGAGDARGRAGLAVRRGDDERRQSAAALPLVAFRGDPRRAPDGAARRGGRPAGLPALSRLAGLALVGGSRPIVAWYGDMTFLPHLWRFLRQRAADLRRLLRRADPGSCRRTIGKASRARPNRRCGGSLSRLAKRGASRVGRLRDRLFLPRPKRVRTWRSRVGRPVFVQNCLAR